jgi:uridylate kinase
MLPAMPAKPAKPAKRASAAKPAKRAPAAKAARPGGAVPAATPVKLLKLSGEVLGGSDSVLDPAVVERVCAEILAGAKAARVAIVVGGGNILRGGAVRHRSADPTRGDYQGMLATHINALALQDGIEALGGRAVVFGPHAIPNVCKAYDRNAAVAALADGQVVIFGGGTGHPFFTTDTTAALRAAEVGAGELLKASKVDGIYNADPRKDETATRFTFLTYDQAIAGRYGVMDMAAFALCRERAISIRVFDMTRPGAITAALGPKPPGTLVGTTPL